MATATATVVQLSSKDVGNTHVNHIPDTSGLAASQVLTENHQKFHIFMDVKNGLHNHTMHHILSSYALGASPEELVRISDLNKDLQRQDIRRKADGAIVERLHDRVRFAELVGVHDRYPEFLEFFQSEVEKNGVEKTVQEYVFAGDEAANQILKRLYAGYLHPVIHFGFALEFNQPALVAEALAECACSSAWAKDLLDLIDKYVAMAKAHGIGGQAADPSDKTLFDLQLEIVNIPKLVNSVSFSQASTIRDGILKAAPVEMATIAAQWRVTPSTLAIKNAEMVNFNAYFCGAAQRPDKHVWFDFVLMHCANASIFYSVFLKLKWLTDEQKCRLLEMKGWIDLAMYVGVGSPRLNVDEIINYEVQSLGNWDDVIERIHRLDTDDAHTAKLIRALMHGQEVCHPFEKKEEWPIQGDSWLKIGHMVLDSVTATPVAKGRGLPGIYSRWSRGVGFPEAWKDFPDRPNPHT